MPTISVYFVQRNAARARLGFRLQIDLSMAWSHNFKPPSGMPAMGPGWGGPARGAGTGGPARPFQQGNSTRVPYRQGLGDPAKIEKRRVRTAEKQARIAQLTDFLEDLALNTEHEGTRLSATVAALNRLAGYPVPMKVCRNVEPSLADLIHATQAPASKSSRRIWRKE
jgi:hypothetical protein